MQDLDKLFGEIINTRGVYHQLGLPEGTVRALRKKYNDHTGISAKKMREVLTKAGYRQAQPEMWEPI
jgi:hypothetical protein